MANKQDATREQLKKTNARVKDLERRMKILERFAATFTPPEPSGPHKVRR